MEVTLSSVLWAIVAYYHETIGIMPGQDVFGRDMLFNITSLIYWRVVTARNQKQFDIDISCENSRRVRHYYAVGNLMYVEKTDIYQNIYLQKS